MPPPGHTPGSHVPKHRAPHPSALLDLPHASAFLNCSSTLVPVAFPWVLYANSGSAKVISYGGSYLCQVSPYPPRLPMASFEMVEPHAHCSFCVPVNEYRLDSATLLCAFLEQPVGPPLGATWDLAGIAKECCPGIWRAASQGDPGQGVHEGHLGPVPGSHSAFPHLWDCGGRGSFKDLRNAFEAFLPLS